MTQIVQIRIVGMDEFAAQKELLQGIDRKRAKPSSPPAFPGAAATEHKRFPGDPSRQVTAVSSHPSLIPSLKNNPTDIDKRRFFTKGLETICTLFKTNISQVSQADLRIDSDFQLRKNTDFRAEIFVDGKASAYAGFGRAK